MSEITYRVPVYYLSKNPHFKKAQLCCVRHNMSLNDIIVKLYLAVWRIRDVYPGS
jgi:hypothetical protein